MKYKLLGIDYGEANIGLALAQTELAEPLKVVSKDMAMAVIQTVIAQQGIDAVVIGLSEGSMAQKTINFARHLSELANIPVYSQDETLTSVDTRKKMAQGTVGKTVREGLTDHYVAAEILQSFIDEHLPLESLPENGKILL